MRQIVLDVNILVRLADRNAPDHSVAKDAVTHLQAAGDLLQLIPQTIYEFWVVATRPLDKNGLGFSIAGCQSELARIRSVFPLLKDKPDLFETWQQLVADHQCHGKVAHDARYVASMKTQSITHILTFNGRDFARFPGIIILDPHTIAASVPPRS